MVGVHRLDRIDWLAKDTRTQAGPRADLVIGQHEEGLLDLALEVEGAGQHVRDSITISMISSVTTMLYG